MYRLLRYGFLFLLFGNSILHAQPVPPFYLEEALESNLVLKEKKIALDKSLIAIREARALFLPSSAFEASYTLAQGGRNIQIPVGDLLNPVYRTLNQLTASNNFPEIKNASEQLNPDNFYDVRIRTTLPLVNPDLKYNLRIREQQKELEQSGLEAYRRELIMEVKNAYYNFLATGRARRIYENALGVVRQNLRVNQSLLENGKGLPAWVARAESEVRQVEAQVIAAANEQNNARAYFNFLRNKPLEDSIQVPDSGKEEGFALPENSRMTEREELKSLQIAGAINQQQLKMQESFRTPRINAFLDLAAQGFDFRVNRQSLYYLGGLQLQIPLFAGKRNLMKIQQTRLQGEQIRLQRDQLTQQLALAEQVSRNNVITAQAGWQSARQQEEAARQYFKLVDRGYREGVNSFIEFLDARTQYTNAQLQTSIQQLRYQQALTRLERETATYTFTR